MHLSQGTCMKTLVLLVGWETWTPSEGDFTHPRYEFGNAASPQATEGAKGKHNCCNPDIRVVVVFLGFFCVFFSVGWFLGVCGFRGFFVKLRPLTWLRRSRRQGKTLVGKCKHGLWELDEKTDLDKKKMAHAAFNIGCAWRVGAWALHSVPSHRWWSADGGVRFCHCVGFVECEGSDVSSVCWYQQNSTY